MSVSGAVRKSSVTGLRRLGATCASHSRFEADASGLQLTEESKLSLTGEIIDVSWSLSVEQHRAEASECVL